MRKFILLVLCIILAETLFAMNINKGKTIRVEAGFHTFGRSYDIEFDGKKGSVVGPTSILIAEKEYNIQLNLN